MLSGISIGLSKLPRDNYNDTPLHSAIINNHLDTLKFFIEKEHCDPNIRGQLNMTLLQLSLKLRNFGISMYLISLPHCDVLSKVSDGIASTNILRLAVETQDLGIISHLCNTRRLDPNLQLDRAELLEATDDVDILNFLRTYLDPLHHAAAKGDLDTVRHYVEREKWDPNKLDGHGNKTLHIASQHGQLEVVEYLTELTIENVKCDPNSKDRLEKTPLCHAGENGHLDVMKYLVETHHCDPLCPDKLQQTTLHRAAAVGNLVIVKYITLTMMCNPLVRDGNGSTPLHYAALYGHLEVVKFFIEDMKCDPNSKGQCERSLLHYASETGRLDVVKYLINMHHCDPLCLDEDKGTPLHRAAAAGQLEIVKYFTVALDCTVLIKNSYHNTPLHCAVLRNHLEVVKFLIESKYDPNIHGQSDMTPLQLSLRNRHFSIAMYYHAAGSQPVFSHPLVLYSWQ